MPPYILHKLYKEQYNLKLKTVCLRYRIKMGRIGSANEDRPMPWVTSGSL